MWELERSKETTYVELDSNQNYVQPWSHAILIATVAATNSTLKAKPRPSFIEKDPTTNPQEDLKT